jgi:acyl-CoA thioesterase FadM
VSAQRFLVDVAHRPQLDGSVWETPHLAFYEVLEAVSLTWGWVLDSTGRADLAIRNFAVVSVNSDFHSELFVGQLAIDTAVIRVGTSSLTLEAAVVQSDDTVGRVQAVLGQINGDRSSSSPLTSEQRDALDRIAEA